MDVIIYTDDYPTFITYAISIEASWDYIVLDETHPDGMVLNLDQTPLYSDGLHAVCFVKLPMSDVEDELGDPAGFMLALDGYMEVLAIGTNRGGVDDPFTICWDNPTATDKYDLAYPRQFELDEFGDPTEVLAPRSKFCEFDG